MAVGQLRLGIPGNTSTNFASSPLTALTLTRSPAGAPLAVVSTVGWATLSDRSNRGTAIITGPSHSFFYSWAISALLTQDEALHLQALAQWQNDKLQKKESGFALRLIDETKFVIPEPSPHSRVLLQSITPPFGNSYRYGYGVFPVKLEIPEDLLSDAGRWASGNEAKLLTFGAVEL